MSGMGGEKGIGVDERCVCGTGWGKEHDGGGLRGWFDRCLFLFSPFFGG